MREVSGPARPRRRPSRLRPGDTVALVSPASPVARGGEKGEDVVAATEAALRSLGLRTVVGSSALDRRGYLAGTDEDRARDLMEAFADPGVHAVVCTGGGYGTPRLLQRLDYDLIAARPKIFVGYSDVTALHTAIGRHARLVTFHGPMGAELGRLHRAPPEPTGLFTWRHFVKALMGSKPLGPLPLRAPWQTAGVRFLVPGVVRAPLVGGNLSLLAATLGTDYEIDAAGKILLIEEVGEAPYRVDRLLTQLALAGKLRDAAGFIVAEWTDCDGPDPSRPTLTLEEVLADVLTPLGKPTAYGLAAGHGPGRLTLPLGVTVTLDGDGGRVVVEEPAVS